jgi:hypothetical protein
MRRLLFALSLLGLSACANDLTPAWRVIEPRLYAARVEVVSDPSRSRPAPGESFVIRQFLALPKPLETPVAERYSMELALCFGFPAPNGQLICAQEVRLPVPVTTESDTELRTGPIPVPDVKELIPEQSSIDAEFGVINQVSVFGALCVEGKVERVPDKKLQTDPPSQLFRCTDNKGAEFPNALTFTMSVLLDLGRKGDLNHNPSLACDPDTEEGPCQKGVEVEGETREPGAFVLVRPDDERNADGLRVQQAWPALGLREEELPWTDCESSELLQVEAGSGEHLIRVRFDAADREHYEYETEEFDKLVLKREREELLLSHAVTEHGGTLSGHFSVVERNTSDDEAEVEITYKPPKQSDKAEEHVPEGGRLVRMFFALRDGRGGVDFTTRELCLLPPASSR